MIVALMKVWALLATHCVADWFFQTNWQAQNKSKNNVALSKHVGVYTLSLAAVILLVFGASQETAAFIAINGAAHWATDYVTSRIASSFYTKDRRHAFFGTIGVDQLIHQTFFVATAPLLFANTL